jgi:hypothetical protein
VREPPARDGCTGGDRFAEPRASSMLRTVFLVARGFSVGPRNAASGCMSLRRGARRRHWRISRGCGKGPGSMFLDQMPLHFRVRDESEFAKRALVNGHEPLLLPSKPGDDIAPPSREAPVAVRCMFGEIHTNWRRAVSRSAGRPDNPGSRRCGRLTSGFAMWRRRAGIVHSISTSPT